MPGIPTPGATRIADDHNEAAQFANAIAAATGIDPRVVYAWAEIETGGRTYGGYHNWLNLRPYPGDPYSGVSPGNFEEYRNVHDAEVAAIRRIRQPFASPILASVGSTPANEIAAIASTGWDAGHYGGPGGPSLLAEFRSIYPNVDTGSKALGKGTTVSGNDGNAAGPGGAVGGAVRDVTGVAGDVAGFLEKWVIRGALIVLGTALAIVGLYFIARALGAPSLSPLDTATRVMTRGTVTPSAGRQRGMAAASRGEEVTTVSRPEPVTKSDRRQVKKNERGRERAARSDQRALDEQYGDIPF